MKDYAPKKSRLASWLLFRYIQMSFRRRFHSVELIDDEAAPYLSLDLPGPFIFYSTHSYWWDGFFDWPIIRKYNLDYSIMMEEKNLSRFSYFRKTGVFGVDLDTPEGRTKGLLRAVRILKSAKPRRSLILYPHGRWVPEGEEWPPFQKGLELISRQLPDCPMFPVAKKIFPGNHPKPEVIITIGKPLFGRDEPSSSKLGVALRATCESSLRKRQKLACRQACKCIAHRR